MTATAVVAAGLAVACSSSPAELSFVGPQVEGVRDFHVVPVEGAGGDRLLSGVAGLGTTFLWLPDGQTAIVYREAEREYYLADLEQGSLGECLTCAFAENLTGPSAAPDGRRLAWSAPQGVYLQDLQKGALTQLAAVARPGWINWSPDGRYVTVAAREGSLQIYRLEVGNGEILQLTHAMGEPAAEAFAPAWSPTAGLVAFHALDAEGLHLMSVGSDGEGLRRLADWTVADEIYDPALQAAAAWSPDGETLLFPAASGAGDLDIYAVGADGSGLRNLTRSPGDDWDPVWSPDGTLIAFTTDRDGNAEIYLMNADGSGSRNLSQRPTTPEINPAWKP